MAEQYSYEELLSLVERMVQGNEDGTLYVRTDHNRAVVVGVEKGAFVALTAGPRHGLEALPILAQASECTVRRVDTVLRFHANELPSSSEILHLLRVDRQGKAAAGPLEAAEQADGFIDGGRTAEILCEILHDYLGPVASMICDDVTDGGRRLTTPAGVDAVIQGLSAEIESSIEAQEFVQRANARLAEVLK